MDLCEGEDALAEEIMYFTRLRGYVPAITPTIGHALVDMAGQDQNRAAMATLFNLERGAYGIQFPTLDPIARDSSQIRVNTGIAGFAADEIVQELNLVDADKTTALVIAEASVMKAQFVVLEDTELTNIDQRRVNSVLSKRSLVTLKISGRMDFYGYVSGQRGA
jgi:hypothetical protein